MPYDELVLRPVLGVLTLKPYTRETVHARPTLPVVLKYSEVAAPADIFETLWLSINGVITVPAIVQFAQTNNLLLKHGRKRNVHAWLHEKFLRSDVLRNVKQFDRPTDDPADWPDLVVVFHRLACLFVLKLLLGLRDENRNGDEIAEAIGDLALLANEFVKPDRPMLDHLTMIAAFLPEWELDNHTNIANSVVRLKRMLEHAAGNDAVVTELRAALTADFTSADGIPHDSYFRIVITIFHHVMVEVDRSGKFAFNTTDLTTHQHIPEEHVAAFFRNRAFTPEEFRAALAGEGWTREQLRTLLVTDRFATDAVLIRRRPFLRVDQDVLVLDVGAVVDLVSHSIYYSHFNSLLRGNETDLPRCGAACSSCM